MTLSPPDYGLSDPNASRQKFELVRRKAEDLSASLHAVCEQPVDVQEAGMRFTLDVIVLVWDCTASSAAKHGHTCLSTCCPCFAVELWVRL